MEHNGQLSWYLLLSNPFVIADISKGRLWQKSLRVNKLTPASASPFQRRMGRVHFSPLYCRRRTLSLRQFTSGSSQPPTGGPRGAARSQHYTCFTPEEQQDGPYKPSAALYFDGLLSLTVFNYNLHSAELFKRRHISVFLSV